MTHFSGFRMSSAAYDIALHGAIDTSDTNIAARANERWRLMIIQLN